MASKVWSPEEVRLTIEDYFEMLEKESAGQSYNKTEHNRNLQTKLNGRSKAAIELKHQNISAVLHQLGYVFIKGYKPKGNFQRALIDAVGREADRRDTPRQSSQVKYPFKIHSWEVYSPNIAVKTMDKSSFLHHGSAIPKGLFFFFKYSPSTDPKPVTLLHGGTHFAATLTPDNEDQRGRARLFWRDGFAKVIAERFPQYLNLFRRSDEPSGALPEMRLKRDLAETDTYQVEFIVPEEITSDSVPSDVEPWFDDVRQEGARKQRVTTVYERDLKNRLAAIHIHGMRCLVCGFDFGEFYGAWGAGYIEVHHLFPLAAQEQEREVDPTTDLVPVCANCHRMFHRKKDHVLSLEEVRLMVKDSRGLKQ